MTAKRAASSIAHCGGFGAVTDACLAVAIAIRCSRPVPAGSVVRTLVGQRSPGAVAVAISQWSAADVCWVFPIPAVRHLLCCQFPRRAFNCGEIFEPQVEVIADTPRGLRI